MVGAGGGGQDRFGVRGWGWVGDVGEGGWELEWWEGLHFFIEIIKF